MILSSSGSTRMALQLGVAGARQEKVQLAKTVTRTQEPATTVTLLALASNQIPALFAGEVSRCPMRSSSLPPLLRHTMSLKFLSVAATSAGSIEMFTHVGVATVISAVRQQREFAPLFVAAPPTAC